MESTSRWLSQMKDSFLDAKYFVKYLRDLGKERFFK